MIISLKKLLGNFIYVEKISGVRLTQTKQKVRLDLNSSSMICNPNLIRGAFTIDSSRPALRRNLNEHPIELVVFNV
jgi:hypothetical protein